MGQSTNRDNYYFEVGGEYNRMVMTDNTLDGGGLGKKKKQRQEQRRWRYSFTSSSTEV